MDCGQMIDSLREECANDSRVSSTEEVSESKDIFNVVLGLSTPPVKVKNSSDYVSEETDENTSKLEENVNNSEQSTTTKTSRELKSLLELAKEANLDTNILHKRKGTELTRSLDKSESVVNKSVCSTGVMSATREQGKRSMRSQNPDFVAKHQKFLSLVSGSDSESMHNVSDSEENKPPKDKSSKRNSLTESGIGGALEESSKKIRKPLKVNNSMVKSGKDAFCWRCHRDGIQVSCETCPRSYHLKCLRSTGPKAERWPCPECISILRAESTKTRLPALKNLTLEQLCGLLKFAHKRMTQCTDAEPFMQPVNETEFPEYRNYIVYPMDLMKLERNIKENTYGSTTAFEADAKWLLHNSIIFNSYQAKVTSMARSIVKICRQEMAEIENCASCYLNANTKKDWFVDVCPKPHLLVWAKLKGFPYWPAKAMGKNSQGMVDVRFFGAHDRAWIPFKECFLFSRKDPNSNKHKRNDIKPCIRELEVHIEKLKEIYGEFNYAPYRTQFDPNLETEQLQMLLPRYKVSASDVSESRENNMSPLDDTTQSQDGKTFSGGSRVDTPVFKSNDSNGYETDEDSNFMDAQSESRNNSDNEEGGDESAFTQLGASTEDFETQVEPGTSYDNHTFRGKVRTRGGYTNTTGKIKTLPQLTSVEGGGRKRLSSEDSFETTRKISRRNSDQSIKSDSSRISSVSDRISKVDISENVEIALGNDETGNVSVVESISPDVEPLGENKKKPPIQVNVENKEFTISPSNKCPITDRLLKKLREDDTCKLECFKEESMPINVESLKKVLSEKIHSAPSETAPPATISSRRKTLNPCLLLTSPLKQDTIDKDKLTEVIFGSSRSKTPDPRAGIDDTPSSASPPPQDEVDSSTEDSTATYSGKPPQKEEDSLPKEPTNLNVDSKSESNLQEEETQLTSPETESTQEASNPTCKKRKISCDADETPIKKLIKVVDINTMTEKSPPLEEASEKTMSLDAESSPVKASAESSVKTSETSDESVRLSQLSQSSDLSAVSDPDAAIKSEILSDEEDVIEVENLEAKRKYLSALNISEKLPNSDKPKQKEIQTRSKTEEKIKVRSDRNAQHEKDLRPMDNVSKIIDSVASHYSKEHEGEEITLKTKKENLKILNFQSFQKQKARKTFPKANLVSFRRILPTNDSKPIANKTTSTCATGETAKSLAGGPPSNQMVNTKTTSVAPSLMVIAPTSMVNSLAVLPPNQTIYHSANVGNQVLTMVPTNLSSVNQTVAASEDCESQNYIPQNGAATPLNLQQSKTTSSTNVLPTVALFNGTCSESPMINSGAVPNTSINTANNNEINFSGLADIIPDSVSRAITELLCRPPPKLKPRPPGPLSTHFEEPLPSSAGSVTCRINSMSHRLNDYFRGMLIETLQEMGGGDNKEATITNLRLEIETLKHKHNEEIMEIKKNINSVLKDLQKSIMEERQRIIDETRASCEMETIKRVQEAKSKQWCANCYKEAFFFCCWNTSYCDYNCQKSHWTKHSTDCQNSSTNQQQNAVKQSSQPVLLRQANPPKTFSQKSLLNKSAKFIYNRTPGSVNYVKNTSGNHLTIVESTPGKFELVGNGPIAVGGKIVANSTKILGKIKPGNIITVSSPSTGTTTTTQQTFVITQARTATVTKPTTTTSEQDTVTEILSD